MNIARFGYQGVGVADTVFFPLYPYLVGGIFRLTNINVTLIGILVSSIATFFALVFLYELVMELFKDKDLAKYSTICLAFYPTGFFLHAPYTDALFLALSIGSILFMVKKRPIIAGLFGCAAGLTRAQGILLLIPMIVMLIQNFFTTKKNLNWKEFVGIILTILGFAGYSYWRMQSGLDNFFTSYQTLSKAGFRFPLTNLFLGFKILINNQSLMLASELFSVLFFLVMLIWMATNQKFKNQIAILAYSFSTWLLITSKTTYFASPLQSANRYVLHIFFVFVGMGELIKKLSPEKKKIFFFICLILSLLLLSLYPFWVFIG